jgi:hypothetical protein
VVRCKARGGGYPKFEFVSKGQKRQCPEPGRDGLPVVVAFQYAHWFDANLKPWAVGIVKSVQSNKREQHSASGQYRSISN